MKAIKLNTKTGQVLAALKAGERLTDIEATACKIGNLGTEVYRIRQAGYAVDRTHRVLADGTKIAEYSLGTPSRDIVALGYLAKSKGLTFEALSAIDRSTVGSLAS